jgi:hypothetical protein
MRYRTYSHEERVIRRASRPSSTPQQDLRRRARVALECLLHTTTWADARVLLVAAVEEAAGSASADELADLEQVLLAASSAR